MPGITWDVRTAAWWYKCVFGGNLGLWAPLLCLGLLALQVLLLGQGPRDVGSTAAGEASSASTAAWFPVDH